MNDNTKKMREIQAILQQINDGKKVFFNLAIYEKMGLVYTHKIWRKNAVGNDVVVGNRFLLTKKAKQFINVLI